MYSSGVFSAQKFFYDYPDEINERKFFIYFPHWLDNEINLEKKQTLQDISKVYLNSLSPIQKEAIKIYESDYYRAINSYNRGKNFYCKYTSVGDNYQITRIYLTDEEKERIKALTLTIDDIIKNAPKFPFDISIFRTANLSRVNDDCVEEESSIDEIMKDSSFKSFSTSFFASVDFCRSAKKLNCVVLHVIIPANTPLFYISGREDEVILSRDTKLKKQHGGFSIHYSLGKIIILNATAIAFK